MHISFFCVKFYKKNIIFLKERKKEDRKKEEKNGKQNLNIIYYLNIYLFLKRKLEKKIKSMYSIKISQMRCLEIATKNEKLRFAFFVDEINCDAFRFTISRVISECVNALTNV